MSKRILILFALFSLKGISYARPAVNIKQFHNTSFDHMIEGYCGVHLQVSGSYVTATYIIPPRSRYSPHLCWEKSPSRNWKACDGKSRLFKCDGEGFCKEDEVICDDNGICEKHENPFPMVLMEDGNLFFQDSKYLRSGQKNYFDYCRGMHVRRVGWGFGPY